jgi:hypothetical protein
LSGGAANASPAVATIIEMATTLAANPTPDRIIIVLHSHATTHAPQNAMREPWIGSVARRIVASICRGFACEAFAGRSSMTLRRCDKETRVRKIRLGWNGLEVLLGAVAPIDSEHAH